MITTLIFDFSNVLLFPKDRSYTGKLNDLHKEKSQQDSYNVFESFELDRELLQLLRTLKEKVTLHLFTEGSMHQIPEIRNELDTVFDSLHSAKEIGYHKSDPLAFTTLTTLLGMPPAEALFIDDKPENIEAAKLAGLNGEQYASLEKLRDTLKTHAIL